AGTEFTALSMLMSFDCILSPPTVAAIAATTTAATNHTFASSTTSAASIRSVALRCRPGLLFGHGRDRIDHALRHNERGVLVPPGEPDVDELRRMVDVPDVSFRDTVGHPPVHRLV